MKTKENSIIAGIVLFNPDIKRLKENINAIKKQVEKVILVDNHSENYNQIYEIYKNDKNVYIISNEKNHGIASGLNQIINYCIDFNHTWALTLDQDSVCSQDIIEVYQELLNLEDVAVICPKVVDRNYNSESENLMTEKEFEYVDECITSASLVNVSVCYNLGMFDETMFIDLVDFEYCYRVRKSGLKIIKTNKTVLLHQLGDLKRFNFGFFHVDVANHSPLRKYYYFRNCIYFMKKHRNINVYAKIHRKMISKTLQVLLFEKDKLKKGVAILKGINAGFYLS